MISGHKKIHKKNLSSISITLQNSDNKEKSQVSMQKSPYASSFLKKSSMSRIKNKSISCANSGIASPLFGSSPSSKRPQNGFIKKNFSTILSRKKVLLRTTSKKLNLKDLKDLKSFKVEGEILEEPSNELDTGRIRKKIYDLASFVKQHQLNYELFEQFRNLFKEVIAKDKAFGNSLAEIKTVYEDWIKCKVGYVAENSQLKTDINNLNARITELEVLNHKLKENLKKISVENAKVGKENEMKDKQYRSLQEHLIKINNIDKGTYPPTEDTWKLVLAENKTYSEICDCMKTDIKNLKKNENKLLDLIEYLRNEGYPVDEIYKQIVYPKYNKKKSKLREVGSEEDENLIISPQKMVKKPELVPKLKLDECLDPTGVENERESSLCMS